MSATTAPKPPIRFCGARSAAAFQLGSVGSKVAKATMATTPLAATRPPRNRRASSETHGGQQLDQMAEHAPPEVHARIPLALPALRYWPRLTLKSCSGLHFAARGLRGVYFAAACQPIPRA